MTQRPVVPDPTTVSQSAHRQQGSDAVSIEHIIYSLTFPASQHPASYQLAPTAWTSSRIHPSSAGPSADPSSYSVPAYIHISSATTPPIVSQYSNKSKHVP